MEDKIESLLLKLGICPALLGYNAVYTGVRLLHERPEYWDKGFTKALYPAIAKEVGSTPSRVDRNIRTAIQHMFDAQGYDRVTETLKFRPSKKRGVYTVSEFLALCVMRVRKDDRI